MIATVYNSGHTATLRSAPICPNGQTSYIFRMLGETDLKEKSKR